MAEDVSVALMEAQTITIATDADYEVAADYVKSIKSKMADVKAFFSPMKEAANQAHTAACPAEEKPEYIGRESGIVVQQGQQVVCKEGICAGAAI